jgi:hypothetical protein
MRASTGEDLRQDRVATVVRIVRLRSAGCMVSERSQNTMISAAIESGGRARRDEGP